MAAEALMDDHVHSGDLGHLDEISNGLTDGLPLDSSHLN